MSSKLLTPLVPKPFSSKKTKHKKPPVLERKFWMRHLYRPLGTLLFKDQLLRNYMHVGFRQRQTSQECRSLILGTYKGVSIFHPTLLTFLFRRAAKMILLLLLRGNRLCLVSKDFGHFFPRNDMVFPGQLTCLDY